MQVLITIATVLGLAFTVAGILYLFDASEPQPRGEDQFPVER